MRNDVRRFSNDIYYKTKARLLHFVRRVLRSVDAVPASTVPLCSTAKKTNCLQVGGGWKLNRHIRDIVGHKLASKHRDIDYRTMFAP